MRKLSEQELKLVQMAISEKGINSAELLMEVYDHFLSHLESFPEEQFEVQLNSLNLKWSRGYCAKLQDNLRKNLNKTVRKIQWNLIKSYFSWPKFFITLLLIGGITLLINLLTSKLQLAILFSVPLIYLTGFLAIVLFRTHQKLKPIKSTFKDSGLKINSLYSSYFITYLTLPFHFYNICLNVPRILKVDQLVSDELVNYLSIGFCFIMYIHAISVYEAWKIKSKTALI